MIKETDTNLTFKYMYCKKCGDVISLDNSREIKSGIHDKCVHGLQHCNYCGELETNTRSHYMINNNVFCVKDNYKCYYSFIEELNDRAFKPYENIVPIELKKIFLEIIDYREEFFELLNKDGYMVILNDSDGNISFEHIEDNLDILKFFIKKFNNRQIGFNCNQYVDYVIHNKKPFDFIHL